MTKSKLPRHVHFLVRSDKTLSILCGGNRVGRSVLGDLTLNWPMLIFIRSQPVFFETIRFRVGVGKFLVVNVLKSCECGVVNAKEMLVRAVDQKNKNRIKSAGNQCLPIRRWEHPKPRLLQDRP